MEKIQDNARNAIQFVIHVQKTQRSATPVKMALDSILKAFANFALIIARSAQLAMISAKTKMEINSVKMDIQWRKTENAFYAVKIVKTVLNPMNAEGVEQDSVWPKKDLTLFAKNAKKAARNAIQMPIYALLVILVMDLSKISMAYQLENVENAPMTVHYALGTIKYAKTVKKVKAQNMLMENSRNAKVAQRIAWSARQAAHSAQFAQKDSVLMKMASVLIAQVTARFVAWTADFAIHAMQAMDLEMIF